MSPNGREGWNSTAENSTSFLRGLISLANTKLRVPRLGVSILRGLGHRVWCRVEHVVASSIQEYANSPFALAISTIFAICVLCVLWKVKPKGSRYLFAHYI